MPHDNHQVRSGALPAPGSTKRLGRALDAAFGHPRGPLGRLGAVVMARGNAEEERRAVTEADLRPGATVLVVGHGPGIGVQLAASAVGPRGQVTGIDPSPLMTQTARGRCTELIDSGVVVLRGGSAEDTGCVTSSMDAVISVNNVMLWELPKGFAEIRRVLRPRGRLVVSVHQHVLGFPAHVLVDHAVQAGLESVQMTTRPRRRNSAAIDLTAQLPLDH